MTELTTQIPKPLDEIAFEHYGRHDGTTEAIYEANRHLADLPLIIPAGTKITLPELPSERAIRPVSLYD